MVGRSRTAYTTLAQAARTIALAAAAEQPHPSGGQHKLDCRDIIEVGPFGDKTFAASGSGKAVVVI